MIARATTAAATLRIASALLVGLSIGAPAAHARQVQGGTVASDVENERRPFIGHWSGELRDGTPVEIEIAETGVPIYRLDGERIPVRSPGIADGELTMVVGLASSMVSLAPAEGDGLDLHFTSHGSNEAIRLERR